MTSLDYGRAMMACPQAPRLVAAGEQLLPPVERLCAGAPAGAAPLDELDSVLGELAAVTQVNCKHQNHHESRMAVSSLLRLYGHRALMPLLLPALRAFPSLLRMHILLPQEN